MRVTLAFTIKEFLLLLRDPGGLFVLFMMPVMFMVVFSLALAGCSRKEPPRDPPGRWRFRWRRAARATLPTAWWISWTRLRG